MIKIEVNIKYNKQSKAQIINQNRKNIDLIVQKKRFLNKKYKHIINYYT